MNGEVSNVSKYELDEILKYLENEEWLDSDDPYDCPTIHPPSYYVWIKVVTKKDRCPTIAFKVSGLADLKSLLGYNNLVDLEYITSFYDGRYYKKSVLTNDLLEEDFKWLLEDSDGIIKTNCF